MCRPEHSAVLLSHQRLPRRVPRRRNEQLTISYVDAGLPLAQRRQALEFGYGFTCRCPRCTEEEGYEGRQQP